MILSGKIIVVTGGAGALGRAFVQGIAKSGGTAIVTDINREAATRLCDEMRTEGYEVPEAVEVDITSKGAIQALIKNLMRCHGKIDAVINNAYPRNKHYGRKLEDVAYTDFCDNVSSHLGGYFLVAQQFCALFKSQGYGNLVNMSSIYGSIAPRFEIYDGAPMTMPVEYVAIKAAVEHLTRYFAQYFKGAGIRVNSLSPGGILANQPGEFLKSYNEHCSSKGMLAANDIVGALIFLLSDESRYITGQNLCVDDGFSL